MIYNSGNFTSQLPQTSPQSYLKTQLCCSELPAPELIHTKTLAKATTT